MATIDIKLSLYAFEHQPNSALGAIVDGVERIAYVAALDYWSYASSTLSGSSLVFTYPDGAVQTYSGFVKDRPGASTGTATAAASELLVKDGLVLSYSGKLNLDYATTAAGLGVDGPVKGSLIKDIGFATLLPTTDPKYDAAVGNVSMRVTGALVMGDDYALTGTASTMSVTSEKNLLSLTIDGDFRVNGNVATDGATTHAALSGTLTGYHQLYADGSHFDISGASATLSAPYSTGFNLFQKPDYFAGDDTINIDLPSILPYGYDIDSGAGDDQLTVRGGRGLTLATGEGNDRITLLDDGHEVYGGTGIDTVVLPGTLADYRFSQAGFFYVTNKLGTNNVLLEVERLQFSDTSIALDVDGDGGQAYRLYQAAFARTPDKIGLGFWIHALDGGTSLLSVAQGFIASDEFKQAYGASPSNHDLVVKFYENILHRAPESAGLDYWVGVLDNKQANVADVLMAISESTENKVGLIGVIGNGFEYTPYHAG